MKNTLSFLILILLSCGYAFSQSEEVSMQSASTNIPGYEYPKLETIFFFWGLLRAGELSTNTDSPALFVVALE